MHRPQWPQRDAGAGSVASPRVDKTPGLRGGGPPWAVVGPLVGAVAAKREEVGRVEVDLWL